jgi:hypothetical protein
MFSLTTDTKATANAFLNCVVTLIHQAINDDKGYNIMVSKGLGI